MAFGGSLPQINLGVQGVTQGGHHSHSNRHCWRSPLPHNTAFIQRDFVCVPEVQQTKQLPHVAKLDLVWQLGGVIWDKR
ncbi:hypothetical protein TNCV_218661 [Trichonephila clavipes]|uniref:Uncharacterized protein n=1 Tax=Trichonephila clavipes TaxID=2585209 RepID=A0A8X6VFH5_TRICX|nr:hypothetical protein TNCV_218661 [Trichonephila clavipes]